MDDIQQASMTQAGESGILTDEEQAEADKELSVLWDCWVEGIVCSSIPNVVQRHWEEIERD